MWNDNAKNRYWWIKCQNQLEEFLCELSKAEDEEEVDLYLLTLHFNNESDLKFFTQAEQEWIKKNLSILMHDTEKHRGLLAELSEGLKELWIQDVEPTI